MITNYTVEIQRRNVTPAQFLAYVRRRLKATGGDAFCGCLDLDYFAAGSEPNYDTERDGTHCISHSKPYSMQTYICQDGRLYNEICEFEFDDEKTGHGYYYLIDAEAEPETAETATEAAEITTETTETTETAPAAEPETETETTERAAEINPMCTDCIRRGSDCDGTTCETWTGCIYRETAAQRDIRLFDFYKRRLLALAGGEPLRWVCVQYLCSFPGLSPYDMGAELIAEGVEIIYDDTAITRAENAAERRRVQRAYAAREGVRA